MLLKLNLPKFSWECLGFISTTRIKMAEPIKRRKKIDVNIMVNRENKKKKKFEKEIRSITRRGEILKPILEMEPINVEKHRIREMESIDSQQTIKKFAGYRKEQMNVIWKQLQISTTLQQEVLLELETNHPKWYKSAIQPLKNAEEFEIDINGPSGNLGVENYEPNEGVYVDITPNYDKM
ncbi:39S ribosomal protein L40, mitochondrial [Intoshia linei]|uniref:Large ribosomal subunit protein mL40 n=1 Tax=Intoshia linei TaxID=1819745 RepID=A0A177B6L2_9BILA|nr:39S ribosomal protein L40, mitochondrial [Intoshia linei]